MPEINKQRPVFLELPAIHLPLPGKLSIMHRISGGALFLMLPVLIYLLQLSLGSAQDFDTFRAITSHSLVKLALLALMYGFIHHFCMGIRILLIDMHKGVEINAARKSAKVVLFVSIALTVILGVSLW
jgi:succinate dehydrogenase / fumarate reductase cytochrome b subunit